MERSTKMRLFVCYFRFLATVKKKIVTASFAVNEGGFASHLGGGAFGTGTHE
jgi:hypothetical protein